MLTLFRRYLTLAWGLCALGGLVVPHQARGAEGMWLPYALPDHVMVEMQRLGLTLGRAEIFSAQGTGIANAVVHLGATGSFVSPEGLILTNHHVAYGAVQRISTSERNYIKEGFLARTIDEEVPAHGYRAYVLLSSEDVTAEVLAAVNASMAPLERKQAIEDAIKKIVRRAEEGKDVYCEVNEFYGGAQYLLDTYLQLTDVRVVYVPSRSIGEYGGDIDNWMWPRHAGDFSFLRAYVGKDGRPAEFSEDNVPYRPASYLRVSKQGLEDGEFAMIIGYPGRTSRYLTSYGLAYRRDFDYPERIHLYRRALEILYGASDDPEAAVRVAGRVKAINNRLKNNLGMLEGFENFDLVDRQIEREKAFTEALEADPQMMERYGGLLEGFRLYYQDLLRHAKADLLLEQMVDRGTLLSQAMLLYKWSLEKAKDDLDRDPDYMDREIPELMMKLRVFQMGFHEPSDRGVLRMLLREASELPDDQAIAATSVIFDEAEGGDKETALDLYLDRLYAMTKMDDPAERTRMFGLSHEELMAEDDAFIHLAALLYDDNEARLERQKQSEGAMTLLMPRWIEAQAEYAGLMPYPDANGTMRLNYGVVKGYSPRDAVYYEPLTTLTGVVEKHTGVPPFDCPEQLLDLAGHTDLKYDDPLLGDVPVDILTTHDSTGGNSGSPLLNSRGELVGCLFDGNYEAMTSDFLFMDDLTRSISVDIRYVLFIADRVDGARNLLRELGVD
jgi:hypothetical protein